MARQIFRQEALDRLASPDRLDQLMPLTSSRGWIALAAVGLLAAVALAWAIFGTIAVTVSGDGLLTRGKAGVVDVITASEATLISTEVEPEQLVEQGQVLAKLSAVGSGEPIEIKSPVKGRVLSVQAREGERLGKGAVVLKLEKPEERMQAIIFVPSTDAYRIHPSMTVRVWAGMDRGGKPLTGKVKSVSRFPAGQSQLSQTLQSEDWATTITRGGPVVEVVVHFEDPEAEKDYFTGTPCKGEVTVERQRPISMILPVGGQR